jgi:hypothetical protein
MSENIIDEFDQEISELLVGLSKFSLVMFGELVSKGDRDGKYMYK